MAGFGSKAEIEKLMLNLEGQQDNDEEETAKWRARYTIHAFDVFKYICFIVLFNSSVHGNIEGERGRVEVQEKTKKGNQPNLMNVILDLYIYSACANIYPLQMYRYIVIDASYHFYTANNQPREKTVSKKFSKKKTKTESLCALIHMTL